MVFVFLVSCTSTKSDQSENTEVDICEHEILIKLESRVIRLVDSDFEILRHDGSFDLKFANDSMITFLRGQKISEVQFCLDSTLGVAKPLHIISSNFPESADYAFPVVDSGYTSTWADGVFSFLENPQY